MRLDKFLVLKGYAPSREKAKTYIINGLISVNNKIITKPGCTINGDENITIKNNQFRWVSRSASKLEFALTHWNIDIKNKICLDIGASTGGFSQVLLHYGAKIVYAIDVGHNQLATELQNIPNLIYYEGINAKDISKNFFEHNIDFITVDISFISITKIIHIIYDILIENGKAIILIKPQFEVGKKNLNKGIVKKNVNVEKILNSIKEKFIKNYFKINGLIKSPIKGKNGNQEYLLYISKFNSKI